MTRVLQIRRGTTAKNNNFTGMPGEVTYDTEVKTLRVHDGATLGGFALARADQIGEGSGTGGGGTGTDFDINSVPAEFWQGIVTTYAPKSIQTMTSKLGTIANVSYIEAIFNNSNTAKLATATLVCQTPDAGYAIGDIVSAFGIGTRANPTPNTFTDENGMHVRLMVGGENFWVSHRDTGATTQITNAKWKVQFNIWY